MNDYSKWDKLQDSDEEDAKDQARREAVRFQHDEDQERVRKQQEAVDQWLRRAAAGLSREEPKSRPPELQQEQVPFRKVTKEERKVLAMLIVLSHFEEGTTNLERHPEMLELCRHHRWLEGDPGTLELLCRAHNASMRKMGGGSDRGDYRDSRRMEDPEEAKAEARMREMIMSGINTLAGPKKCGLPGGLLELMNMICTPTTEVATENRKKWQKKEFAKDALFDSLFPDLRHHKDMEDDDGGMKELWIFAGIILFMFAALLFLVFGPSIGSITGKAVKMSTTTTTTLATTTTTSLSDLTGGAPGAGREDL